MNASGRLPRRGEIWFCRLETDPPGKGPRPVLIVSADGRNLNDGADTILAVPLTTSIHKDIPTHIILKSSETGLNADSAARAEDVTVIRKSSLIESRIRLRQISNTRICQLGAAMQRAIGCV